MLNERELGPKRMVLPMRNRHVRCDAPHVFWYSLYKMYLTVFLVQAPELKVAIAPPSVVELVGICDLGDKRARVFCKRVEENAVDDDSKDLDFPMLASPDFRLPRASHFAISASRRALRRTSSHL